MDWAATDMQTVDNRSPNGHLLSRQQVLRGVKVLKTMIRHVITFLHVLENGYLGGRGKDMLLFSTYLSFYWTDFYKQGLVLKLRTCCIELAGTRVPASPFRGVPGSWKVGLLPALLPRFEILWGLWAWIWDNCEGLVLGKPNLKLWWQSTLKLESSDLYGHFASVIHVTNVKLNLKQNLR